MFSLTATPLTPSEALAARSKQYPDAPVFVHLDDNDKEVQITSLELERAAHRAASLLHGTESGEVVGVIGMTDTIVYHATVLGLMTANAAVNIFIWNS
jgi:acyl-CoA synthetase (AMP-forming)/AMP-acid ligase II